MTKVDVRIGGYVGEMELDDDVAKKISEHLEGGAQFRVVACRWKRLDLDTILDGIELGYVPLDHGDAANEVERQAMQINNSVSMLAAAYKAELRVRALERQECDDANASLKEDVARLRAEIIDLNVELNEAKRRLRLETLDKDGAIPTEDAMRWSCVQREIVDLRRMIAELQRDAGIEPTIQGSEVPRAYQEGR